MIQGHYHISSSTIPGGTQKKIEMKRNGNARRIRNKARNRYNRTRTTGTLRYKNNQHESFRHKRGTSKNTYTFINLTL